MHNEELNRIKVVEVVSRGQSRIDKKQVSQIEETMFVHLCAVDDGGVWASDYASLLTPQECCRSSGEWEG